MAIALEPALTFDDVLLKMLSIKKFIDHLFAASTPLLYNGVLPLKHVR